MNLTFSIQPSNFKRKWVVIFKRIFTSHTSALNLPKIRYYRYVYAMNKQIKYGWPDWINVRVKIYMINYRSSSEFRRLKKTIDDFIGDATIITSRMQID